MTQWPRQVSREEEKLRLRIRDAIEHALDQMESNEDPNEILGQLIAKLNTALDKDTA